MQYNFSASANDVTKEKFKLKHEMLSKPKYLNSDSKHVAVGSYRKKSLSSTLSIIRFASFLIKVTGGRGRQRG